METVDIIIIGAGMSGIGAAYFIQKNCPDQTYRILESRLCQGGTWSLFRYPGIRSDSDMYTFGYSFEPWINKSSISDGKSILEYSEQTTKKYHIDDHIQYNSSVQRATWDSAQHMWKIEYIRDGVPARMRCRFIFLCTGYYSYKSGYSPTFPGVETFKGQIVHPQDWPIDLDYSNKKVVVIGSGATAVTLIPSLLQPPSNKHKSDGAAAHVTMLQRSPSYVVAAPAEDPFAAWLYQILPSSLAYWIIRWRKIFSQFKLYTLARMYPKETKKAISDEIQRLLGPDFDVGKHFSPRYDPWDQRLCLCPDGDFFKAIQARKASVVTDEIDHFSPHGIVLKSGDTLDADIIVTATGLNMEILGGIEFCIGDIDPKPVDLSQKFVYKGCMISDLPNLGWWMGYTNASYTLKSDLTSYYFSRMVNYMTSNKFTAVVPIPSNPSMPQKPLLNLTSGYMQRGRHIYPKQSVRWPWTYNNNYFIDWYVLCFRPVRNKELQFSSLL